jgi:hypothetical protein
MLQTQQYPNKRAIKPTKKRMKLASSLSFPGIRFLTLWGDIRRRRGATIERLHVGISGIQRDRIMKIMEILELPILHTVISTHAGIGIGTSKESRNLPRVHLA